MWQVFCFWGHKSKDIELQVIFIKTELLDYRRGGDAEGLKKRPPLRKDWPMKAEMEGKIKYGFGDWFAGAVVAMVIGLHGVAGQPPALPRRWAVRRSWPPRRRSAVAQFIKEPNSQEKLKELRQSIAINDPNLLKRGAGIKCLDKGVQQPVWPTHVSQGLKFLSRNRQINKGELTMSEGKVKWF